jgi:hypothetical protein
VCLSDGFSVQNRQDSNEFKVPEILQLQFASPASYPINYSDQLPAGRIARKHYDGRVGYIVERYRAVFYDVCQERG